MDQETLSSITEIAKAISNAEDWKQSLNAAVIALRKIFIFDNIAIYRKDDSGLTEVIFARAVGRGQAAEADAAWGEEVATHVLTAQNQVLQDPRPGLDSDDRLAQAYLLGLPLVVDEMLYGAVVFVRFGGPPFVDEQLAVASLAGFQIANLIARNALNEKVELLNKLEKQMRLQEDFVTTITHDLRTPLGFIKGYTTTLLRADTTWDESTQREFLTIIDEETDRLAELIEKVLESARLQSETLRMNFQPTRLDALLREISMRAQTHSRSLRIKLDIGDCPSIQADNIRLSQVFENLFSNTMKYAPGASITVSLHAQDDHVTVIFSDNGPGIAQEFLPFIFERFYRVPGQASGIGTGLGLFICKQVILAHHGKIWAESQPGQGTRFFIELPIVQK